MKKYLFILFSFLSLNAVDSDTRIDIDWRETENFFNSLRSVVQQPKVCIDTELMELTIRLVSYYC